jgi:hypothetical protein
MTILDTLWARLDALRHLSPADPLRQAALDALWLYWYPDWHYEPEADCVVPF